MTNLVTIICKVCSKPFECPPAKEGDGELLPHVFQRCPSPEEIPENKNIKLNDYRRGVLYGIIVSQKMTLAELYKEIERDGIPFKKEYTECCAFLAIIFLKIFKDFIVHKINSWEEEDNKESEV